MVQAKQTQLKIAAGFSPDLSSVYGHSDPEKAWW